MKDFKSNDFGSVHYEGVTDANFGSVHSRRLNAKQGENRKWKPENGREEMNAGRGEKM
jgi:hypothetical protein